MVDFVSAEKRARIMRGSKSKNSKPELEVRRALWRMGYRFRIHARLPGKPDVCFWGRKTAIFVHGCFWHQHDSASCSIVRRPSSNLVFWNDKFRKNKERDFRNKVDLESEGWTIVTVWECELQTPQLLESRLADLLGQTNLRHSLREKAGSGTAI